MRKPKVKVTAGDYIVPLEKWKEIEVHILSIMDIIEGCEIMKKKEAEEVNTE